ncbi:MAG: hypothetical protein NTX96_02210 [Candidatus Zambryskibacteria bacterium]|nr:hypothetical protein [Candidatus Zambryskibacteria bacterium]
MGKETSLSGGRGFELELFGVSSQNKIPDYLDFFSAMQEVAETPLLRSNPKSGRKERYNPIRPNWGKLYQLWFEVEKHLPWRSEGIRSGPLSLYISIGTSLDFHHGVDCFFWWMGAYLTIDASLALKEKRGRGKEHLKADLLITPDDLTSEGLVNLGEKIATLLKRRRYISRKMSQKSRNSRNRRELCV